MVNTNFGSPWPPFNLRQNAAKSKMGSTLPVSGLMQSNSNLSDWILKSDDFSGEKACSPGYLCLFCINHKPNEAIGEHSARAEFPEVTKRLTYPIKFKTIDKIG